MATATMKKTVKCNVGGVSSQKTTTSLSINIDRASLDLPKADELLVGAQLELEIFPAKDVEGQEPLFDEKHSIKLNATCANIHVTADHIGTRFKMDDKDAPLNEIAKFKFRPCKITMKRVGNAANGDGEENGEEAADEQEDD